MICNIQQPHPKQLSTREDSFVTLLSCPRTTKILALCEFDINLITDQPRLISSLHNDREQLMAIFSEVCSTLGPLVCE